MNSEVCILVCTKDPIKYIEYNFQLINELSKKFRYITVLNFINIKKKQVQINQQTESYSNVKFFSPINNREFLEHIESKKILAFDFLPKSFDFFKIRNLINHKNIYLISLINVGGISNQVIKISKDSLSYDLKSKFIRYIYRFLVLINYLPAINLYFDPRKEIIENTNLQIKKRIKIQNIFKKLNINYFKESYRINCKSYDNFILNKEKIDHKKIIFIDSKYDHPDIEQRNGKISDKIRDIYFSNLERVFSDFEKNFNLKVDICLHPGSNIEIYKKFFKNRNLHIHRTSDEILNAKIILFHESGSVTDAITQKKIVVSLETRLLGKYYYKRIINNKNLLNFYSLDIDQQEILNKDLLLQKFKNSLKNYEIYINNNLKSDNIPSYVKITNILYDKVKNNNAR